MQTQTSPAQVSQRTGLSERSPQSTPPANLFLVGTTVSVPALSYVHP